MNWSEKSNKFPYYPTWCFILYRLVEGKVVEIARLQTIFSEKVLEQEGDIFRISDTAIHTTENLKSGNESIRQVENMNAWNFGFKKFSLVS